MKISRKPAMAGMVALVLSGCGAMPHHASIRTEMVSQLVFQGGPEGATVLVDGAETGRISGKKTVVPIADGAHAVSVQWQGRIFFGKTVFIADGTKKIIPLGN